MRLDYLDESGPVPDGPPPSIASTYLQRPFFDGWTLEGVMKFLYQWEGKPAPERIANAPLGPIAPHAVPEGMHRLKCGQLRPFHSYAGTLTMEEILREIVAREPHLAGLFTPSTP